MNTNETREVVRAFGRAAGPGFAKWRTEAIALNARSNGTSDDAEWSEQLASWQRTLAEIELADGLLIVGLIETGEINLPLYGEMARTIAREARFLNANDTGLTRDQDLSGRRVNCRACRDSGLVRVWNPLFVVAYRADFGRLRYYKADRTAAQNALLRRFDMGGEIDSHLVDPSTWEGDAGVWWRHTGAEHPINHMALCCCNCQRARRLLSERVKHEEGKRRRGWKLPACGAVDYDPKTMPVATGTPYLDLRNWYEAHPLTPIGV